MRKQREALLGIAIGRKESGKTYETLKMINQTLVGNQRTGGKPRRVLILDVNNEFSNVKTDQNPDFAHIKALRLKDVRRFTTHPIIEARRVSVIKEGGGKMNLDEIQDALHHILENYQNGLLLIEDMTKFISDSLPSDLIGSMATLRHISVDIVTHFQTLGKMANPKLWGNANWIRMHKCDDTVQRHENKFGGNVTHLKILEKMVNIEYAKGNIYFNAYLNKDKGKLQGNFNKPQFTKAVESYLEDNYKIVTKEVNAINLHTGSKKHRDHQSAVKSLINQYGIDYYGNK